MFIMVRKGDNVIIGNATRPVDERVADQNGYVVYEMPDKEFDVSLIGTKLDGFEEVPEE